MVSHRVHQTQLSDNIQAQFIYENTPIFAGSDDFSLLIKFKYTGKHGFRVHLNNPFDKSNSTKDGPVNKNELRSQIPVEDAPPEEPQSSGWFGSRLSSQLSNATRAVFFNSFEKVPEQEKPAIKNAKETLFLGFSQILGYYFINDSIVDYTIFRDLQRSTIIEGKYAGIKGLEVSKAENSDSDGFFSGFSALYSSELNSLDGTGTNENLQFIPFFSSDQNIIFSELEFDPNRWTDETASHESIKSFYLRCKLPKDLPPTMATEAVQINYKFIFCYQLMEGQNIISRTAFVPLKIQTYIDKYGRQPIFHLQNSRLNQHLENFIVNDVSKHPEVSRHNSSINTDSKKINFFKLKKQSEKTKSDSMYPFDGENKKDKPISSSMSQLELSSYSKNDITSFLDIVEELDRSDVNDIIKVQEKFDKKMDEKKVFKFNVRENLLQILADYKSVQRQTIAEKDYQSLIEYDHILPKEQQIKFVIKQNHEILATVLLNKGIFNLGSLINLNILLHNEIYDTTGLEIQLLKHQIFHREEYIKKGTYGEVSSRLDKNILESIMCEKMISTFKTSNVNTDILIPLETEPQFKTNFFQIKYYLQIRFITVNNARRASEGSECEQLNYAMKNIFTDTNGSMLFQGKEILGYANEFYIRIPVIILPTYEQDFGFITTTS